jgi:hypothetical protein
LRSGVTDATLKMEGNMPDVKERLARFAIMGAKKVEQDFNRQRGMASMEDDFADGMALINFRTSKALTLAKLLKVTGTTSFTGNTTVGQARPQHLRATSALIFSILEQKNFAKVTALFNATLHPNTVAGALRCNSPLTTSHIFLGSKSGLLTVRR